MSRLVPLNLTPEETAAYHAATVQANELLGQVHSIYEAYLLEHGWARIAESAHGFECWEKDGLRFWGAEKTFLSIYTAICEQEFEARLVRREAL